MMDLADRRRFYAEEIEACCNLRSAPLVDALATIPRERFLRPGPWMVRGEGDMLGGGPRTTPDADPKHVYHNLSILIDPARQLANGAPGVIGMAIDALGLASGSRVVHIGCGLGYYTAIISRVVGPTGQVLAIEVDEALAAEAKQNLSSEANVEVRHGDGTEPLAGPIDAMLVNAGVTHPRDAWLDALTDGGKLVMPVTMALPQMGTIGKGPMFCLTRSADGSFEARTLSFVAIYSALGGLRDAALNEAIGKALTRGAFVPLKRLRRDPHEVSPTCWLHGPTSCLSL